MTSAEQARSESVGLCGRRDGRPPRESSVMVQSKNNGGQLSGVRVLVVEDDPLLATDLDATLVEAGAV